MAGRSSKIVPLTLIAHRRLRAFRSFGSIWRHEGEGVPDFRCRGTLKPQDECLALPLQKPAINAGPASTSASTQRSGTRDFLGRVVEFFEGKIPIVRGGGLTVRGYESSWVRTDVQDVFSVWLADHQTDQEHKVNFGSDYPPYACRP
jgi:hypothetical protein